MRSIYMLLCLCLVSIASLHADTVVMTDGSTLEGTISDDGGEEILVTTKFGKLKVKRADIAEIRRAVTTREAFAKRRAQLASGELKDNAQAWVDLALAARKAGFRDEMKDALKEALKLDPENVAAKQVLAQSENQPIEAPPAKAPPARAEEARKPAQAPAAGQPSDAMTPLTQKTEARDCPTCSGYGVLKNLPGKYKGFPCMTCAGKGKLDKVVTYDGCEVPKGNHLCPMCDGKKFGTWKPCEKCSAGEMPGLVRRMSGYLICDICKGLGEIPGLPCRQCKGIGFLKD